MQNQLLLNNKRVREENNLNINIGGNNNTNPLAMNNQKNIAFLIPQTTLSNNFGNNLNFITLDNRGVGLNGENNSQIPNNVGYLNYIIPAGAINSVGASPSKNTDTKVVKKTD